MTATRTVPTSASPPPVTGSDFMDAVAREISALWDYSRLPMTNVGGTANAITADIVPALTHGLVDGMGFLITPIHNTTGAVTINGVSVVDTTGAALVSGAMAAGTKYQLVYDGPTSKLVLLGAVSIVPTGLYQQLFTASGTYTPTAGMRFCIVTMLGAGGSGAKTTTVNAATGGAAGALSKFKFTAAQIGISKTVTIGAGGAAVSGAGNGNDGGSTSLGALGSAPGGNKGTTGGAQAGALGGVASGGYLNINGGNSDDCLSSSAISNGANAPMGFGYGGKVVNTTSGLAGTGYGSGGAARSGSGNSGKGQDGLMLIEEFT